MIVPEKYAKHMAVGDLLSAPGKADVCWDCPACGADHTEVAVNEKFFQHAAVCECESCGVLAAVWCENSKQ